MRSAEAMDKATETLSIATPGTTLDRVAVAFLWLLVCVYLTIQEEQA